jgi:hypothetical protein
LTDAELGSLNAIVTPLALALQPSVEKKAEQEAAKMLMQAERKSELQGQYDKHLTKIEGLMDRVQDLNAFQSGVLEREVKSMNRVCDQLKLDKFCYRTMVGFTTAR